MAFVKKTWKDRIVQYANRRLLTKSGGEVEQVTVTRDEGTISEAGDQFNASNMNDLEQRVEDGLTSLTASEIEYSSGVSVADELTSLDNQLAVASGTFTAQTNVTVGSKNAVYKQGHWVFINLVLVCGANISANSNLAQTSIDLGSDIYIPTLLEPEKMIVLKSNGTYISTDFNIANGSILRIGTTIYVP